MSEFDLEYFLMNPSWDQIRDIRKADWVKIAEHFQISLPAHSSKVTKAQVKDLVLKCLIDKEIIEIGGEYVIYLIIRSCSF